MSVIPAGGGTTDLTIVPPVSLSLDVLKQRLNAKGSSNDAELTAFLSAAVGVAERYLRRAIVARTVTNEYHNVRSDEIKLHWFPVIAVTGIVAVNTTTALTYSLADLDLNRLPSGILRRANGYLLEPMYVSYTAGASVIESETAEGIYEIAVAGYESTQRYRRGAGAGPVNPDAYVPYGQSAMTEAAQVWLGSPPPLVG